MPWREEWFLQHSSHPVTLVGLLHAGAGMEPWSFTCGEGPYLGTTVRSLLNAESNESWVCHSHQNVVNAVDVNAADAPALHVSHDVPGG